MCSSNEAKEGYRKVIYDNLLPVAQRISFITINDNNKAEILEKFLQENMTTHMKQTYDKWVKAETLAKEELNNNNQQAFFA